MKFDRKRIAEMRKLYIPDSKVLEAMNIQPDDRIIDFGAGDGYYSILFSNFLRCGYVYAIENDDEAISMINERINDNKKVQIINGDLCDMELPEHNKAFFSNVFHDIECRDKLMKKIVNTKYVVLIEFKKGTNFGPPESIKINQDELESIFNKYDFKRDMHIELEMHYIDRYIK
ncbi:class I SAM-dependent methyltransferase [Picrophilus oshimae]|uniref:Ribosomal RNA adenine dimethylase n=1 Tax=Picrophilus torridus (strain ATCC 700027 / DSM 9790 / JCM 10055 / NBRC 100828 / KAW 2/3) TaxID=1122961 RepID=A0A8G2FVE9_PICTO|nr:rRNA adenine N-6-methyltransferase family protein [Picrophilus oshimae]SMD30216.1 Ribosomal RNA adenine dimethylase [Picrophilus oshimae DSM 9789]